mmetsp:Transcript_37564/g.67985  ORF Transcript_37564/g.67985 Transcript_37564/m.67985 type:complete len:222 (+) Transcript_37564:629-1294(+)
MAWCCRRLSFLASSFACASFPTLSRSFSLWSSFLASLLLDLRTTGWNPSSPFPSSAPRRTHLARPTRPESLDPPEDDSLTKPESPSSIPSLPPEGSSDDGVWGEEECVVGSSSSFPLPAPSSSPPAVLAPSSPPPPAAAAVVCSAAATRSSRLTSLCAPLAKSGLASMIGRPSRKISVSSPSSKEAGKPAPPRSSSDVEEEGCCCPPPSSAEAVVLASAAL